MSRPLGQQEFVCLDCETTGLDPKKDRILELAVVKFNFEKTFASFESLIDPERDIPEESIKIHRITAEMVKGKPPIAEVLPVVLRLIGSHVIVGHGVGFDVEMLIEASKLSGIPCHLKDNLIIDTLRMARLYGESPINSLEHLRKHFHIPEEGAHRAMNDVVVNVEVFKQLGRRYQSLEQLLKLLSKPIMMTEMPLGKHKGRSMRDIPIEYLRWAARKNFDQDLLYSIRYEISRRNKRPQFTSANNPFKNL